MDFQSVEDWQSNELSKAEYGRMPWHDVAMGLMGDSVYDIAEHFVLRWNFIKRDKYKRSHDVDWLLMEGRTGEDEDLVAVQRPKYPCGEYIQHPLTPLETKPRGMQGSVRAQLVRSSDDWSSGILNEHSIQNAYCETIRNAQHFVYIENQFFITATGSEQHPIYNNVGRAIVDACVRAGKENRKFRVIIVIPAIPGFAGDLRDNAATGTRAIMDYQYKSICRGENSIYGQIRKEGVDPTRKNLPCPWLLHRMLILLIEQIFVFALRAYDRINKTPALEELESKADVNYQDIQRGIAESIMSESVHPAIGKEGDKNEKSYDTDSGQKQEKVQKLEKFEKQVEQREQMDGQPSKDSVAHVTMLNGGKMVDQPWEGDLENEKANIVQEELYVHGKVCIVDDRTVICGSANINDRVSQHLPRSLTQLNRTNQPPVPTRLARQRTGHRHGRPRHNRQHNGRQALPRRPARRNTAPTTLARAPGPPTRARIRRNRPAKRTRTRRMPEHDRRRRRERVRDGPAERRGLEYVDGAG